MPPAKIPLRRVRSNLPSQATPEGSLGPLSPGDHQLRGDEVGDKLRQGSDHRTLELLLPFQDKSLLPSAFPVSQKAKLVDRAWDLRSRAKTQNVAVCSSRWLVLKIWASHYLKGSQRTFALLLTTVYTV